MTSCTFHKKDPSDLVGIHFRKPDETLVLLKKTPISLDPILDLGDKGVLGVLVTISSLSECGSIMGFRQILETGYLTSRQSNLLLGTIYRTILSLTLLGCHTMFLMKRNGKRWVDIDWKCVWSERFAYRQTQRV